MADHPKNQSPRGTTPLSAPDSLPEDSGATLTVPADIAALFAATTSNGAGYLRRVLDTEFRRNGTRVPYLLERWLDQLEAHQRATRVSTACPTTFRPSETVSVTEYASTAGTSVQAVRARCRRGTLPATRVDGAWRIFTEGPTDD